MFLGVLYLMLCHCLKRTDTSPASLFHNEDLLSGQNDSSAWVYADTLIHNDAFERNKIQMLTHFNAYSIYKFIDINTTTAAKKKMLSSIAFWFKALVCRLTPSTLPSTRRDTLERVARLQLGERSSLRVVLKCQNIIVFMYSPSNPEIVFQKVSVASVTAGMVECAFGYSLSTALQTSRSNLHTRQHLQCLWHGHTLQW